MIILIEIVVATVATRPTALTSCDHPTDNGRGSCNREHITCEDKDACADSPTNADHQQDKEAILYPIIQLRMCGSLLMDCRREASQHAIRY